MRNPFPIKISNITVEVGGGLVDVSQLKDHGYDRNGRRIAPKNERILTLTGHFARKLSAALSVAADAADGLPISKATGAA